MNHKEAGLRKCDLRNVISRSRIMGGGPGFRNTGTGGKRTNPKSPTAFEFEAMRAFRTLRASQLFGGTTKTFPA